MKNNNKNTTKKSAVAVIVDHAKNAPIVPSLDSIVETSAPKKPRNRLDLLASNAIAFDAIESNMTILFDDVAHATTKHVAHMLKTAFIISRSKNEIFASVASAPYVFRRDDCKNFSFTISPVTLEKPIAFSNVKLTIKNIVLHADVLKNFMTDPLIASFLSANKSALDAIRARHTKTITAAE